ncbi:hypothetical protein BDZ97DRAFT_2056236 [Flammula alnicola]|nr:hypothetical protein BDZ97DRAFT_2056236 [Flammula alnicola]
MSNIQSVTAQLHDLDIGDGSHRFYVLEAKSDEHSAKLDEHIPQVVGECTAILQQSRLASISWCLTTGTEWIFGVIAMTARDNEESRTVLAQRLWLTSSLRLNVEGDFESMLEKVVMTMTFWSLFPALAVQNIFERLPGVPLE